MEFQNNKTTIIIDFIIFSKVRHDFTFQLNKNYIYGNNALEVLNESLSEFPRNINIEDIIFSDIDYVVEYIGKNIKIKDWKNAYENKDEVFIDDSNYNIHYQITSTSDIDLIKRNIKVWQTMKPDVVRLIKVLENINETIKNIKILMIKNKFEYSNLIKMKSGGYIYITYNDNELLNFILDAQLFEIYNELMKDIRAFSEEFYDLICDSLLQSDKYIMITKEKNCLLSRENINENAIKLILGQKSPNDNVLKKIVKIIVDEGNFMTILFLINSNRTISQLNFLKEYLTLHRNTKINEDMMHLLLNSIDKKIEKILISAINFYQILS